MVLYRFTGLRLFNSLIILSVFLTLRLYSFASHLLFHHFYILYRFTGLRLLKSLIILSVFPTLRLYGFTALQVTYYFITFPYFTGLRVYGSSIHLLFCQFSLLYDFTALQLCKSLTVNIIILDFHPLHWISLQLSGEEHCPCTFLWSKRFPYLHAYHALMGLHNFYTVPGCPRFLPYLLFLVLFFPFYCFYVPF